MIHSFKQALFLLFFYSTFFMLHAQYYPGQVVVSTYAGSSIRGNLDGDTLTATFGGPSAITFDASNNMYIGDGNGGIRKITPKGIVTTFSNNVFYAESLAADKNGNLYVVEGNMIYKITPDGTVSAFVGSRTEGNQDGLGTDAGFWNIKAITIDPVSGNMFVADAANGKIRKVTPDGMVTTFAGSGYPSTIDGIGLKASFSDLRGIAIDKSGNLFIASNAHIRKITPDTVVTTLLSDYVDALGIAVDTATGNVYITESSRNRVRILSKEYTYMPFGLAGKVDIQGNTNGYGYEATFHSPLGIAVSATGKIYVTDPVNNNIRKIRYISDNTLDSDFENANPVTSMLNAIEDSRMQIYPIPANDVLTVKLSMKKASMVRIEITDPEGVIAYATKQDLTAGDQNVLISVTDLPAGLYFVTMYTDTLVNTQKVIIVK